MSNKIKWFIVVALIFITVIGFAGNIFYLFGDLFIQGKYIKRNINLSAKFYKYSCFLKNAQGCNRLSGFYLNDVYGFKKDLNKSMDLFKQACEYGHNQGCTNKIFMENILNKNRVSR